MKLTEAIGKRLDNILQERGLSQYHVFKQGGVPRPTISTVVSAKRKTVQIDTIYQIVSTLNMSLKEFFDDELFDNVTD